MRFPPTSLSDAELALRADVRAFLDAELPRRAEPGVGIGGGHDRAFSQALAERGWVGLSIPAEYGGAGRTAVERFVVVEELLAARAPVSAHWVADRQTAPTILRFGTEDQKRRFLPAIARGECSFAIGMSEPDAGSDLAAVRTAAERDTGGWRVTGTKVWTSNAHQSDYFCVLCRTTPRGDDRHTGLSQLIVDLRGPGVTINPIVTLDGGHHFNEVVLDGVYVPDDLVLGQVGDGWRQVTSELAYERSGPDRWLSTLGVFTAFVDAARGSDSDAVRAAVGHLTARYRTLRNLSLSVARLIDGGGAPAAEAALVKDLGTTFEKEVAETARALTGPVPDPDAADPLTRTLARAILSLPSLTIRGGTTEILRTVAARELTK